MQRLTAADLKPWIDGLRGRMSGPGAVSLEVAVLQTAATIGKKNINDRIEKLLAAEKHIRSTEMRRIVAKRIREELVNEPNRPKGRYIRLRSGAIINPFKSEYRRRKRAWTRGEGK